jgi:hypothetical protein
MDIYPGLRIMARPFYSMPVSQSAAYSVQMPHAVPGTVIRRWNPPTPGDAWVVRFDDNLYHGGDKWGPGPWAIDQMILAEEMEPIAPWCDTA